MEFLGFANTPVINILPSVKDIESKLTNLIINKYDIWKLQNHGIKYVKEKHDLSLIARKFIRVFLFQKNKNLK
jgi:hypothetical protein